MDAMKTYTVNNLFQDKLVALPDYFVQDAIDHNQPIAVTLTTAPEDKNTRILSVSELKYSIFSTSGELTNTKGVGKATYKLLNYLWESPIKKTETQKPVVIEKPMVEAEEVVSHIEDTEAPQVIEIVNGVPQMRKEVRQIIYAPLTTPQFMAYVVKTKREAMGLSQADLHRMSKELAITKRGSYQGISTGFITDIESGNGNPVIGNLEILATVLDLHISELIPPKPCKT